MEVAPSIFQLVELFVGNESYWFWMGLLRAEHGLEIHHLTWTTTKAAAWKHTMPHGSKREDDKLKKEVRVRDFTSHTSLKWYNMYWVCPHPPCKKFTIWFIRDLLPIKLPFLNWYRVGAASTICDHVLPVLSPILCRSLHDEHCNRCQQTMGPLRAVWHNRHLNCFCSCLKSGKILLLLLLLLLLVLLLLLLWYWYWYWYWR